MAGRPFSGRSAIACGLALLAAPWRGSATGVLRSSHVTLDAAGPGDDSLAVLGSRPKSLAAMAFDAFADLDGNHSLLLELDEALLWHKDIFDYPKARNPGVSGVLGSASAADWMILLGTVLGLALLDFCVVPRFVTSAPSESGCGSTRSHVAVLVFWVLVGLAFNGLVWCRRGREAGFQWCSGYFLEWLLSMDNLFVFHLIFQSYNTPRELLHKALFLGIIGAALFRMGFFMALASLLHLVHWFRFIFGMLLIYSGVQAGREDTEEEPDISNTFVIRLLRRCLGTRLCERYDVQGQRLFVMEGGQLCATLLVPVIICLEATDILFAVDSVSAKVAQIPDYYIAYSSTVIAMFGLRAMFFIIQDLVECFDLLKYGLCFILVFIGLELMISDYVKLPAHVVCLIILSVFAVCAAGSSARSMYKGACHGQENAMETESELIKG